MTERGEGCVLSVVGEVVRRPQSLIRPGVRAGVAVVIGMCPVPAKSQAAAVPLPGAGQVEAVVAAPAPAGALAGPATERLPRAPEVAPIAPVTVLVPRPDTHLAEESALGPERSAPTGLVPNFHGLFGPYRSPKVPALFPGDGARLRGLVRDGKLYLTLHDALALAIENNLDVEVERDNLLLADTDVLRAKGGGLLRGIDYTVQEPPAGVGGPGSPLLNTATTNTNPTTPAVTDLTALNSTAQLTTNLAANTTGSSYALGPAVPLFDPNLILTAGYLRRLNTVSLVSTTDAGAGGSGSGTTTTPGSLNFVATNLAYLQGFSTGAQLTATANNDSQVIYATQSELDPFYAPSTSVTLTQPLLRGRGRAVNLRYLRIANLDQKVSRLLFEQQVLETIYGVSRLYFDLVSLGENVAVKQEALRAAEKLRQDDADQVIEGTLAPIELTRAAASVTSSRFDLLQAQGLYRQEEIILRNQILRTGSPAFAVGFTEIVPTDRIVVPDAPAPLPATELIEQGLRRRPDLAQSELQLQANQVSLQASRNQVLPQLNVYGNVETRGSSEVGYDALGTPGTGLPTVPSNLALGGLRTSTIYQGGVQLTFPIRNRIAASDAARDAVQLRQARARTERLDNQAREEIENAIVAVETADAAYRAAAESRDYQAQLLQAERDRLAVGQSTNLLVIQNETYLAQAQSTEIAARSDWKKAQIELGRALGTLLEDNHVELDQAISGTLTR